MSEFKKPLIVHKNYAHLYQVGDMAPDGVVVALMGNNKYDVCKEAGAPSHKTCGGCTEQGGCEAYQLFAKGRI